MSFSGKLDAELPIDGLGARSDEQVDLQAVASPVPLGAIIVPDAHLLFTGDFKRTGVDLIISKDGRELLVADYFKSEKRTALSSPDGAHLSGDTVNALTGHVQFAQADGGASGSKVIGHVTKVTGSATAIRNGVSIVLNAGDVVEKGDVVQAGSNSTLGITFIDGTVFGLSSNARMVLNEMIYDPAGSNNSALLSLVQGTISFVAGEAAKHGNMKVDTPVATMGIRGTAVLVEIDFEVRAGGSAPPVKFQVLIEPNGTTGSYILYDRATLNPIATVSQAGTQTIISGGGDVSFLASAPLSPEAQNIITEVFSQKFTSLDAIPKSQFASGSSVNNLASIGGLPTATDGAVPINITFTQFGKPIGSADVVNEFIVTPVFIPQVEVPKVPPTGTITFTDVDPIDVNSVSFALKSSDVAADLPGFAEGVGAGAGYVGTFSLGAVTQNSADPNHATTVEWNFALAANDPVLLSLAEGQTLTLIYTVSVKDSTGETLTKDVPITITGTNDMPTIVSSSNDTPVLIEDSVAASLNLAAAGTVTFRDVDLIDTHTASFALKSSTSNAPLPGYINNTSQVGTFALTSGATGVSEITTDTNNTATVGWSFTVADSDPVLQSLAEDQTLAQIYTITITDNSGTSVTQDVTVIITGTNDAPTITSAASDHAGDVTEDTNLVSGNLVASDTITFQDVDLIDSHTASFALSSSTSSVPLTGFSNNATYIGIFALAPVNEITTDTDNTASLGWTFTLDNNDPLLQSLGAGETITQIYTVTVSDGHGGTVSQDVTITITGTDEYDSDHDVYAVDGITLLFPSVEATPPDYQQGNDHNFLGAQTGSTIKGNNDSQTDHINGQDGNDTIYARGGDDNIQAGGGDDVIYAGSGNDSIAAGSGNDIIHGGSGADQIWGGAGNDTFLFTLTTESDPLSFDTINDFGAGDLINIAGIGFSENTSGVGALTANSLNWSQVGSDTVILGDTDGNAATAEFKIVLKGYAASNLQLSDFILT